MLTEAPKTKHSQRVAAAQSFWWALWSRAQVDDDVAVAEQYRFAKCVCEKFAEYANVSDAELFSRTSENALSIWAMAISHPKSHHRMLHRMRRDAKSLRRQLTALETEPRFEINHALGIALGAELGPGLGVVDWSPKLRELREKISLLIDGLDGVIGPGFLMPRGRGAPSEIDGYPGLAVLVFGLERAAPRRPVRIFDQRSLRYDQPWPRRCLPRH